MRIRLLLSLSFIFFLISICRSASVPFKDLLGIAPQDEIYYQASSNMIKCKDGSKLFTKSQLNDDFCDCPDGTDEPGTSACPNGKFYCRNAGHVPLLLYSSRVNDGFCDCCDGSDEYDGQIKCSNTCWEAGKVARDKLKKKIATYQEGVSLRKREIEEAKLATAKDEVELSKLKNEEKILKGLVQQLKERKEQIEKVEEKERLQKEKEEKEKQEVEEASPRKSEAELKDDISEGEPITSTDDRIGQLEDSVSVKEVAHGHDDSAVKVDHIDNFGSEGSLDNGVEKHTAKKEEESAVVHETGVDTGSEEKDASENTESLSREELGRLVASRWTGEKAEQQTGEVESAKDDHHVDQEESPKDADDEYYSGYESENEEDHQTYDDDDTEEQMEDSGEENHDDTSSSYRDDLDDDESDLSGDVTSTSNPSWLEKVQQTVRNVLQAVNLFQTPVNISEAAQVRKEYDESSAKLSKIQSRISSLTQKLKHDLGPEKEFYSFHGQCFESKQSKYVYKICPFKKASQVEGHSTTHLGSWDKFEDSYRIMQFSNGDKCWNGPDRSLKVKLRCGLKNEVSDIDEPSRCEYLALLSTPALCLEEKLKELQDKLNLMNKEQPNGHDEL